MNYILLIVGVFVALLSNAQYLETRNITPLGFSGYFQYVAHGKDNGIIAVGNKNLLYTSKDTCKSWIIQKAPIDSIRGLIMAEDQTTGFIYNLYQIYKTVDGGKTWQEHKTNGIPQVIDKRRVEYRNFFIKNIDTLFFIVTNRINGMRIYMSIDSGDNWTEVAKDMDGNSYFSGIANMCFVSSNHGFAFGTAGFYAETKDGGLTWEKHVISHLTYFYDGIKCGDGTMIQVYDGSVPDIDGVKWVSLIESYKMCSVADKIIILDSNGLRTTQDMGSSWIQTELSTTCNDMVFLSEKIGVLVGRNLTSYVTVDGGETWTKYVHGGGEGFNNIYCKNENECFITGKTGRLFSTNDGGESWNIQDVHDGALYEIEFPTNDVGYVVGPQVLLKTIDGGLTWNKKKLKIVNAQYIDFFNENVGYLGYSSMQPTIHKTVDGGEYWESREGCYNDTYRKNASGMTKFSFRNENEGVVCGTKTLLHTIDGGETWELKECVPENTYPQSILSIGDKGWLLHTNNHLKDYSFDRFFFYDNNFNCTEIFSGTVSDESGNLQKINDSTYKFSYDTLDFISTDEGLTWNPIYTGMKGQRFFVNENLGYSITNNQIYKYCVVPTEIQMEIIKDDTYNYSLIPEFNGNQTTVVLYLTDENNTKNRITEEIEISNGMPIAIEIPASLPIGSYTLYVEAQDKNYLSTNVGTIVLEKSNAITDCQLQSPIYRVDGKILYVYDAKVKIYTVLGTEIPLVNCSVELKTGVYILVNENETYKIVIR